MQNNWNGYECFIIVGFYIYFLSLVKSNRRQHAIVSKEKYVRIHSSVIELSFFFFFF